MAIIGIDIGGTKCSVVIANNEGLIADKIEFLTTSVYNTLELIYNAVEQLTTKLGESYLDIFGVSCGGPLDSKKGLILSPPNLPGWDNIHITHELVSRFGGQAFLMNDANAGALAEWKFGAAMGYDNIIFLTYGTGMGAGLILNGQLYEGTSDMAGEVGHIRLAPDGPIGYGKAGSFEGFCSGGGVAQLGREKARQLGGNVPFNKNGVGAITARDIADSAKSGDPIAREIIEMSARYAGNALAILIDILNPEIIVLGGFFVRCRELLEPHIIEMTRREALERSFKCCKIVPSGLGEQIGDYAAVSVALYNYKRGAK